MTFDEQYAHMLNVCRNWGTGRVLRFNSFKEWRTPKMAITDYALKELNDPAKFQVVPEPKMAPFGPEDIKPGMVFRAPGMYDLWIAPAQVGPKLISWHAGGNVAYSTMKDDGWEWSTDGVTWHRCEKEEKR